MRIFLNTRGTNDAEVRKELIEFLHYAETTTDETARASDSERIGRIHSRVCEVKTSEEAGVRYMQAWEEKYYERQEGKEEGMAFINELYRRLLAENRLEDLKRALEDSSYQEQLFKEYGLWDAVYS